MVSGAKEAISEDQLVNKVTLRLIPFMLVLYVVSYLDRINISFAALQMNKDLQITDDAFGFGAGIFFFGYCLFGIPSNLIIQRFGPRRWISSIMILWGLVTIGMCFVRNQMDFWILRFVLGIAEAGFFPGMILYLTYWFPPRFHGAAVARFMAAIPLASLLGSAVAAFALGLSFAGLAGWMWLFIVTGIPAVVLGIAVRIWLPDRPRNATWLTEEEAEAVERMVEVGNARSKASDPSPAQGGSSKYEEMDAPEAASASSDAKNDTSSKLSSGFLIAIQDLFVWRFALLYFTLTVSMYGFQLWLPQIIKAFGSLSDTQTALISAIPALFQALGMLIIAGHSDKTGERRFHIVLATGCTFLGLGISCFGEFPWLKLVGLCLAAFGIWGSVGPFWALTTNSLKRSSHATGIAVINSVGNLGGFVGPYIIGIVKQYSHGFNDSLIALAVASVLAGLIASTSPGVAPEKLSD